MKKLRSDWLEHRLADIPASLMANHNRGYPLPIDIPYPIGWQEAEAVLQKMSDRFESWTGRSIEKHLASRPRARP